MSAPLRLFVYGTLKQGGSNHARFCQGAQRVDPAWTWGRLHVLADRYPILSVPGPHVRARGTGRYADDVARLDGPASFDGEVAGWRRVRGELLIFEGQEAATRLPRFDALEDYEPDGAASVDEGPAHGLREARLGYERVMIAVCVAATNDPTHAGDPLLAWTYVCPERLLAHCPPYDSDVWDEATWGRRA